MMLCKNCNYYWQLDKNTVKNCPHCAKPFFSCPRCHKVIEYSGESDDKITLFGELKIKKSEEK